MEKYLVVADAKGKKQPSIHRGIELARRSGAIVHVVAFAYDTYISEQENSKSTTELEQAVMDARRHQIEQVVQGLDLKNVKLTHEIVWKKRISDWVVKKVKTDQYSMIIKTGHRSESLTYTPSDWRIFRESPVPVMIVAEKKWRHKSNILCTLDLGSMKKTQTQLNRRVLKEGKALAKILDSELFCCYAIPVPTVLADLDIVNVKRIHKQGAKKAQARFKILAEEFGLESSVLYTKPGNAEKVVPSIANKLKSRMVIVGTVGRKGLKSKLFGNTAEKVLHRLRTDILTIPPKHKLKS